MRERHTISNGAGLGFVKPDQLCSFGANLNLFVELKRQQKYLQKLLTNGRIAALLEGEGQSHVIGLIKERIESCIIQAL